MSRSPFGPAADASGAPGGGEPPPSGKAPSGEGLEALWRDAVPLEADDAGQFGGAIVGPDQDVLIDTGRALWLEDADCFPMLTGRRGEATLRRDPSAFLKLTGRRMIREPGDPFGYARVSAQPGTLAIMGPVDLAATVVVQVMALAARKDGAWHDRLYDDVEARLRARALVTDDPHAGRVMAADERVLLPDYLEVVFIEGDGEPEEDPGRAGRRTAILFKGRLNKTERRAEVMVTADHAAAVELCAAIMDGFVHSPAKGEFMRESTRRRDEFAADGSYPRVGGSGAVRARGPYLPGEKPGR